MREILFKGKRVDSGEWVKGNYYESSISGVYIVQNRTQSKEVQGSITIQDVCVGFKVQPETVGQYTGLFDKQGVEIFEGDILGGIIGGKVVWIDKQARFGIDICGETNECRFEEFEQNDLEVIGNIYDNPELLKVAK